MVSIFKWPKFIGPLYAACVLFGLVLLAGVFSSKSCAEGLQASPIQVHMPGGMGAAALTLRNDSQRPIHAQVRIFRWTQENGNDVLTPTEDLVASPPFAPIAVNSEQMVRIIRRDTLKNTQAGELTYRLIVDELPSTEPQSQSGVQIQLRYSIPVFIDSPKALNPVRVTFALQKTKDGWELIATNMDNRHVQLSRVSILNQNNTQTEIAAGLFGYVLADSKRVWPLTSLPASFLPDGALRLKATVYGEELVLPLEYTGKP